MKGLLAFHFFLTSSPFLELLLPAWLNCGLCVSHTDSAVYFLWKN